MPIAGKATYGYGPVGCNTAALHPARKYHLLSHHKAIVAMLKATTKPAGEAGDNAADGIIDDRADQGGQRARFLRENCAWPIPQQAAEC